MRNNKDKAIKLYKEGKSTIELGKIFNCSCVTAWHWLKKWGVILRKRGDILAPYRYGKNNPPINHFPKGNVPWNKGKKLFIPWVSKKRPTTIGKYRDERSGNWLGEDAGYMAKHTWVTKRKGKANTCIYCHDNSKNKYEWANISGNYKRNLDDYMSLCVHCHRMFDRNTEFRENLLKSIAF